MKTNPIVYLHQQQTQNLIACLSHQLRMHENAELERAISQFRHSHEQMQDYVEKLHAVTEMAALLTSTLDVATILERMLDTVIETTGAERAFIMLREQADRTLRIAAARAWDRETIDEAEKLFSHSIVDQVLRTHQVIITLNAQDDPRFEHISSVHNKSLRSLLCVPLLRHDQVIGALYADNRVTKGVFQQTLIPVMTAFAQHAVLALENARRYQQTADDLRESRRQIRHLQIQAANQRLSDPLSDRELQVLALIASGAANAEIAEALSIGISTVKKHINHIYSKLDVDNRGRAIAHAHELGLI